MYNPVESNLNFVEREKQVLEFWKENKIFEKSVQKNEGKPEFSFYDGPPIVPAERADLAVLALCFLVMLVGIYSLNSSHSSSDVVQDGAPFSHRTSSE